MESEHALGYLLLHAASTLERQIDQVLQERLGIGFSQYKILVMLQANPSMQQRTMADHLGQTEASISRQIKLLVGKGMLASAINPESKREHIATPTAKGARLTLAAQSVMREHLAPAASLLGDKQHKQLIGSLTALHAWICQPGKLMSCDHPFDI